MPSADKPAFLRLVLRSHDDMLGAVRTWRGLVGGQPPVMAEVVLAYHERVASQRVGSPILVEVAPGVTRLFTLLRVEAALGATETSVEVRPLLPYEPAPPSEPAPPPSFSCSMEFHATGQLAQDIERLGQYLQLRGSTQELAHGKLAGPHQN